MAHLIRKAWPGDIPAVISLMREFAAYEELTDFCTVTEERLDRALFGDDHVADALCAFDGETLIAYAIFYSNFSSFRGQLGLYLEDIYVSAEYRGRGIGEAMIKEIARIAASRGCERIDFMVLDWNTPAVRFYEKLGAIRDADERHFKFTDDAFKRLSE